MDDLTGDNLGPYRVLDRIGAGGMATVYRAYHAAMDRYVAIKVLPRHLARDPDFHARFMREARTIARLEHRHILTVHDVAEEDGVPFLVMRYTNSGDLSGLIASRSLTFRWAVELVSQVAAALAYAHRQGVIHRDVKPANVLISPDGDALLTDFGIAKIYADTLQLTRENQLIGTPAYMAPEQLQAQPVDARTDVYALGIVLYQALTGELPFVAETPLAVAMMHVHNALRPPRQLNPAIPEALERVVLRALAKSPGDRFQSADELAQALRDVLVERDLAGDLSLPPAPIADPLPATAAPWRPTAALPAEREPTSDAPIASAQVGDPLSATAAPWQPSTSVLPERAPASDAPLPPAPIDERPPVASAHWRPTRFSLLIGIGAAVLVAAVAISVIVLFLRPVLTASRTAIVATGAPVGASSSSADLRYPAAAAKINGLAATTDAVWAVTDAGLVRWGADGSGQLFTESDGLPFDEPGTIVSAADGTLWVGGGGVTQIRPTASGISVVASYTKDDGLGSGVIRTLLLDADGSLWAGGPQGANRFALSHFNGQTWHTDELPTNDPALQAGELQIQSLLRSRDGALWLGLSQGELLRWDGQHWTRFGAGVGPGPNGADIRIRRLQQSADGTIWAAASELGLLRFDATQERWQRVKVLRDDVPIHTIAQFADGNLWVAGDGLIARSADSGQTWVEVPATGIDIGSDIGSLVQDSAGRVWAGAYEGGMSLFDGTQWRSLQR